MNCAIRTALSNLSTPQWDCECYQLKQWEKLLDYFSPKGRENMEQGARSAKHHSQTNALQWLALFLLPPLPFSRRRMPNMGTQNWHNVTKMENHEHFTLDWSLSWSIGVAPNITFPPFPSLAEGQWAPKMSGNADNKFQEKVMFDLPGWISIECRLVSQFPAASVSFYTTAVSHLSVCTQLTSGFPMYRKVSLNWLAKSLL